MDLHQVTQELDSLFVAPDSLYEKHKRRRKSKLSSYRTDILLRHSQGKSLRQIRDWLCNVKGEKADHSTISDYIKRCLSG